MNILIVDDNQLNVTLITYLVKKLGSEAVPVGFIDSTEGLAWCHHNIPDLIIVDYMMPNIDGIEFIQRFREIPKCQDIPVLMITANHENDVRYKALESGATDFLNKPIDRTEFLVRAKNMLALRKSQRQLEDKAVWLADEVQKATELIIQRERETIWRLSKAAEYRDPETGAHILRMAHYSRHIAKNLGITTTECDLIFEAAPMHDIGKVGIPDHILLKPGRLTPEEFEIMKQHASIGYEILKDSSSPILQAAARIANNHHEKWDGSGYPNGRKQDEIDVYGRIVAVADVFDALTSNRPYKKAWEWERAIAFLQENSGTHFDPDCINKFLDHFDEVKEIYTRFKDDDQPMAH